MERIDIKEELEELRLKGYTIWSISRLNNYNTCPYGYHLAYNLKETGINNIYALIGGTIHDCIEKCYNNEGNKEDMLKSFNDELEKCDMFGINFPSPLIANNYKADMEHFINNFKKIDGDFITEKGFIMDIDGIKLQGYIDAITNDENGLVVLDWKTSGAFKGDKLLHSGRQLILYKLALEQLTGEKVSKVGWNMLKYVYVTYGAKQKMCSRRKWVKEIEHLIKTDLKKLGYEELIISIMAAQAVKDNNIDDLPREIKDKYIVTDCVLYYDVTPELIDECISYVKRTVMDINNNKTNKLEWVKKEDNFFCQSLCSYYKKCKGGDV